MNYPLKPVVSDRIQNKFSWLALGGMFTERAESVSR
jgi:hypothetical protein